MKIHVVTGGQFGSEAKGAVTAAIARRILRTTDRNVINVRVAGPNAGHTAYDDHGRAWALRTIPQCAVCDTNRVRLVIAPGSEVDLRVLWDEVTNLQEAGIEVMSRLTISAEATLLTDEHHVVEARASLNAKIGSTAKGIGAARADRIMRIAETFRTMLEKEWAGLDEMYPGLSDEITNYGEFQDLLDFVGQLTLEPGSCVNTTEKDTDLIIEGTQGYGLGLHTRYYPKVTSSDTTAVNWLALAGISPWASGITGLMVWVVIRPYPIRVAGNSGPLEGETTWEELGLVPELTTVTKKTRRVGQWDHDLVKAAISANGGPAYNVVLAVTMADQLFLTVKGAMIGSDLDINIRTALIIFLSMLETTLKTRVAYVGTGPDSYLWTAASDELLPPLLANY